MKETIRILKDNFDIIKQEGLSIINHLKIEDSRSDDWYVAPLKVEDEDKDVFTQEQVNDFRLQAPRTTELLEQVHAIGGSFSLLKARGTIKAHRHNNPYITHSLTLQAEDSHIITDGKLLKFIEGEVISFDYRPLHSVHNESDVDRLVLLVLTDIEEPRPAPLPPKSPYE